MFGFFGVYVGLEVAKIEKELWDKLVAYQREHLSKEDFDKWYEEERRQREHRELCQAIRDAGNNARPKGGIFSGFY